MTHIEQEVPENIRLWLDGITSHDRKRDYIFMLDSFLEYWLNTFGDDE